MPPQTTPEIRIGECDSTSRPRASRDRSTFIPLTPEEYAAAVSAHAKQLTETSLYPGQNFENLALYLQRAPDSLKKSQSYKPPITDSFATLYALYSSGSKSVYHIEDVGRLEKTQEESDNNERQRALSQLLFMKGTPSADWLSTIGAMYRVDPEYFQRHLSFRATFGRLDYFPLPSLPSSSTDIIKLRYVTIGHRNVKDSRRLNQNEIKDLRATSERQMRTYLHQLNMDIGSNVGTGSSIVRAFSVHDETHFTIEQEISVYVGRTRHGWTAVVWLDSGNSLTTGPKGPWLTSADHKISWGTSLLPTIQYQPKVALKAHRVCTSSSDRSTSSNLVQSASLLHLDYGKLLDDQLLAVDPFYALHELFTFCAFSEIQFLNLMESKILAAETTYLTENANNPELSNLLYSKDLLEAHASRLRENIETISSRGSPTWPRPADASLEKKSSVAADTLHKDYTHLLARAETLSQRCQAGMHVMMNNAMIGESKRAMTQAQEMTKLTRLAFFFIPLSFTTSLFGMNLSPIISSPNGVWMWVAVSAPLLFVSMAALVWDIPELFRRIPKLKEWRRGKDAKI